MKRIDALSPAFTRVTFTGDTLSDFGDEGLDQRIKIVLPHPEFGYSHFPDEGDWYDAWRALPNEHRNVFRTYTARSVRRDATEVDVDFVTHGDSGPASAWVGSARVGDELVLVGPDATSGWSSVGIEWNPGEASTVLLAGDETAVPAIGGILESLPSTAAGCVFLEVPTAADVLPLSAPDGIDVRWLARDADAGHADHGELLIGAVRDWTSRYLTAHANDEPLHSERLADIDVDHEILWEVPEGTDLTGEFYAWLAGEAASIKTLRRFLVTEVGIDRHQVAFMGYWRLGKAES